MRTKDQTETTRLILNLFLFEFFKILSQKLSKQKLNEFVQLCEDKPTAQRMKTWLEKNIPEYGNLATRLFNKIITQHSTNNHD